ncbi:MAG TPA: roadblock/LC7 domain-containing protein [Firmicutes bacterium]|nr:roadblock/LC7 domain-containing protein [Bacillota bacterium]
MKLSVIGEKIEDINEELEGFLRNSNSTAAILCEMSGEILTSQGEYSELDTTTIASLAAGSFATTKGIANLLGEREFSLLFHQGKATNIFISNIESYAILIIVFNNDAVLGVVKQTSQESRKNLVEVFQKIEKQAKGKKVEKPIIVKEEKPKEKKKEKTFDFDSLTIDDIDDLF